MKGGIFGGIKVNRPPYSKFDMSHDHKLTLSMGKLTPVFVKEVLPGDKWRVRPEFMMRLAPTLAPVMHRVDVRIHYFFVPYRIVWDEWEDFRTRGRLGTSQPVVPYVTINTASVTAGAWASNGLADHMGIRPVDFGAYPTVDQNVNINALNFRAYQQIWNDYFRDQNVSQPVPFTKGSGDMNSELSLLMGLRLCGFEKDYFTSALPFAQRGPAASMPVDGQVDLGDLEISNWKQAIAGTNPVGGNPDFASSNLLDSSGNVVVGGPTPPDDRFPLTDASFLITVFRRAARLQEWLERNARAGGRYVEYLMAHFGVKSSDARLQRAEYLGGIKKPVTMSEVLTTYQDGIEPSGDPTGSMAGHGISVGSNVGFTRSFEEDGVIIGLMSVIPRTGYQQGIPKMYRRFDTFDYYNPEFANIGEQEVKVGELWYDPAGPVGEVDETFGYQSRFAEYKYSPSTVAGLMRSDLSYWHFNRIFSAKPVLNADFIDIDPITRPFAVQDNDNYNWICQCYHDVSALRLMPYHDTPQI